MSDTTNPVMTTFTRYIGSDAIGPTNSSQIVMFCFEDGPTYLARTCILDLPTYLRLTTTTFHDDMCKIVRISSCRCIFVDPIVFRILSVLYCNVHFQRGIIVIIGFVEGWRCGLVPVLCSRVP